MAYPGIACVLIGITVATILYYMFGNEEREAYTYENRSSRYRESNEYYENGYNAGTNTTCTICMSSLGEGRKIVLKGCNHAFHQNCIDEWKCKAPEKSCPNCRHHIE